MMSRADMTGAEVSQVARDIVGAVVYFAQWSARQVPVAWAWASVRAKKSWESARYAWALLLATYRVAVLQKFMVTQDFWIYKVCALNEVTGKDAIVTTFFAPKTWEDSVRVATGWKERAIRVDVRYLAHGKKFRMVLRPGDTCDFPSFPGRHRGGPKGVMAAELVGDDVCVNITPRLLKYQGPAKDFHERRVAVTDLFPYDDPAELTMNFRELRVVDARARRLRIPVTCTDIAQALAEESKED